MNSFVENVNYVAGLDNLYGSGIELYKNNLSLKSVQHDIELKFSYYSNYDKKIHSIVHSEPGVLVSEINDTLLSFKTLVESSITGSEFTCVANFVINNISIVNISIVSNNDMYKAYELEMKIVTSGAVTYDVFGEVKDSLKILPSLAMITVSDIDAIVSVYEIQEEIVTVSENIANVTTVSDSIANVNIVGEDIANVNTVASNIVGLNSIVSNMPEILLADDNAAIATTKALESSNSAESSLQSATDAAVSAASALSSVTTATTKANEASVSATSAATSATNANTSATQSATSAGQSATSASSAASSATDANTSKLAAVSSADAASASAVSANQSALDAIEALDEFTDIYLGRKVTAPTVDNDGNALVEGTIYWNTTSKSLFIHDGTDWNTAVFDASGSVTSFNGRDGAVTLTNTDVTGATGQDLSVVGTPSFASVKVTGGTGLTTGVMSWNVNESTADLVLENGVMLQLGQENNRLVRNDTGVTITNMTVCMFAGTIGNSGRIKVAPFDGLFTNTHYIYGIATQNIVTGTDGYITIDGKVREVNTTGSLVGETWIDGDILYAKPNDNGRLTNVEPADDELKIIVASVVKAHTSGTLEVRVLPFNENMIAKRATKLETARTISLSGNASGSVNFDGSANVNMTVTVADDSHLHSFTNVTNKPTTLAGYSIGDAYTKAEADALHDSLAVASAVQSVSYFLDNVITPGGNYALTNSPDGDPETTIAKIAVAANTPYFMERYISDPIGDTAIDGGLWVFRTYARVSSDVGTSEIISRINKRTIKSGTVTITGTGTSRTITSSDPIFVLEDANSSVLNATLIETPTETFWISAFTSATQVTAITDNSEYVNETSVSIYMYYKLFEVTTGDINGNTAKLYETKSIQPSFNIVPTDSILIAYFAITTSTNKTMTLYKGGTVNYSHIVTPIVYRHNSLKGLNEGEFQHLTTAQLAKINAISGTNTGDQDLSGKADVATTLSGYGITDAYTKTEVQTVLPKLGFDTSNVVIPSVGQMAWNQDEGTVDLGLMDAVLQIGQEFFIKIRNASGSVIANGTVVMASGSIGNSGRVTVVPHDGTQANASRALGVMTQTIADGADGLATIIGKVRGIDTTGALAGETWTDGVKLCVKPNDSGRLTMVESLDTEIKMEVAYVVKAHTNGTLYVRVTGFDENHYKAWVQARLDGKVDKVIDKQLSTEDYTTTEKTKLAGIEAEANKYTHPTTDGSLHVPATSTTNEGKVLMAGATAGSINWQTIPSGVTDHTLLTNIGTNTHAQIDTAMTRLANTSGTNTGDQTITLTGDVTGSGTGSFATALSNTGVSVGTYKSVTVDLKGRITSGTNPTTISGYGITDAYTKAELNAGQLDNRYYTETEIDTLYSTAVKLTGNQTIAGIKTFTSSPIVPTPTTDFQPVPLRSTNITVNVGTGQTYTTINQALEYLSGFYPMYKKSGVKATINLKAGFVMAEQVLVSGIDLGWITIVGEDAETIITHTALTTAFNGSYPAFGVDKGGTSPIIGQLFRFNVEKAGGNKHGLMTWGAGSSANVLAGKGFIGAGTYGIIANDGSTINAQGANCSNAGTFGIYAISASTINAQGANCSNAGTYGIIANDGSTINAQGANCSNAGDSGIYARAASIVNAGGAIIQNQTTGTARVRVQDGSHISADTINTTGGTVPVFNQAINTLTSEGIIYQ